MATLVAMGTILVSCAKNEDDQPQENNPITLTTTISFSEDEGTKALTSTGVKTFAVDDRIAVIYKGVDGYTKRALSMPLTAEDIHEEGKKADIKVTFLTTPVADGAVRYIYPGIISEDVASGATIDDDNATIRLDYITDYQDGSLNNLGGGYDLCTFDGYFSGTQLPASVTLTNRLAILAITVKDNATTPNDITNTITRLTIQDGTHTYNVSRSAKAGPIYVGIWPTTSATIEVTATDGTNNFGKFLANKTYEASNGYNVSWKMLPRVDLSTLPGATFVVSEDMIITGTPENAGFYISFPKDKECTVTLDNVDPDGEKSIALLAYNDSNNINYTVKLKGTSKLAFLGDNNTVSITIEEAMSGGTLVLSNDDDVLFAGYGIIINSGTVKVKYTGTDNRYYAVRSNLTVNGGAVYIDGGINRAVTGTITGTLYEWNSSAWSAVTSGSSSSKRYISTDNITDPTSWTW